MLNFKWAIDRKQTDEFCVLIEDYDDDVIYDVSFECIWRTTVRSSETTSIDSPSSKLKEIRVEKAAKINETVDVYL